LPLIALIARQHWSDEASLTLSVEAEAAGLGLARHGGGAGKK